MMGKKFAMDRNQVLIKISQVICATDRALNL
jgi:hypothetical protein